jgi:membrane associated rhomboid family serine protease
MLSKIIFNLFKALPIEKLNGFLLRGNKYVENSLLRRGVYSLLSRTHATNVHDPKHIYNNNSKKCRTFTTDTAENEAKAKELIFGSGTFRIFRPVLATIFGVSITMNLMEMWRKKNIENGTARRERELLYKWHKRARQNPKYLYPDEPLLQHLKRRWRDIPSSRKLLAGIIAVNSGIFLLWQLPIFPVMYRLFSHTPFSGRTYTLFTSMWSHSELWHIVFNMVALWSFGKAACDTLGKERFLGLYLSSGMIASLVSHLFHGFIGRPVLSLGASGCIYGVVASVAYFYPNAKANLLFVLPLSLGPLMTGLALFETVGLTGLWRMLFKIQFDHAAHLGGLVSGVAYSYALDKSVNFSRPRYREHH